MVNIFNIYITKMLLLNLYDWAEKKTFVSLKLEGQSGVWTRDIRLSKQAALTTVPGTPAFAVAKYKFKRV